MTVAIREAEAIEAYADPADLPLDLKDVPIEPAPAKGEPQ